jgi:uncharacterized protein with LGFP repeats
MTAIDDKHAALPREIRDLLEPPTGPELTTSDGIGRFRHFRGGSIYFTQETGAHEIHGAIKNKWAQLGFERSVLGYPTTDESKRPDNVGRFNHFQHGSIYWNPATGAHDAARRRSGGQTALTCSVRGWWEGFRARQAEYEGGQGPSPPP